MEINGVMGSTSVISENIVMFFATTLLLVTLEKGN